VRFTAHGSGVSQFHLQTAGRRPLPRTDQRDSQRRTHLGSAL